MSITVVQHVGGATAAAATSLVVANALTKAGNTLVLTVGCRGATQNSVSSITGGSWTSRSSTNTAAGFDNLSLRDNVNASSISASGLTINVAVSGSIEYDFWELNGVTGYNGGASPTTGNSATPSLSYTPGGGPVGILFGAILWNSSSLTIGTLSAWTTNYTSQVGIAAAAGSSIQSGILLPSTSSIQTYGGTISASSQWAVAIHEYLASLDPLKRRDTAYLTI